MAKFKKYEIGEKINGIVYLGEAGYIFRKNGKLRAAKFLCPICGAEFIAKVHSIKTGNTSSCGCIRVNRATGLKMIHGMSKSPEFKSWMCMRTRCINKRENIAKVYLNRGISVCERWGTSFENFLEDMGKKPTPKHTIERIENDKGYYKENCCWATRKEQNRNKRDTVYIEIQGIKRPLVDWIEEYGLKEQSSKIRSRIDLGWPVLKAFNYNIPNPI